MAQRLSCDDAELVAWALEILAWVRFGRRCRAVLDDHFTYSCTVLPEHADIRDPDSVICFATSPTSPENAALDVLRDLALEIGSDLTN